MQISGFCCSSSTLLHRFRAHSCVMIVSIFIDRLDGILLLAILILTAQICRHIRQMNALQLHQQLHHNCTYIDMYVCDRGVTVCVCLLLVIDEANKLLNYAEISQSPPFPSKHCTGVNYPDILVRVCCRCCCCWLMLLCVCQVEKAQRLPAAFCLHNCWACVNYVGQYLPNEIS